MLNAPDRTIRRYTIHSKNKQTTFDVIKENNMDLFSILCLCSLAGLIFVILRRSSNVSVDGREIPGPKGLPVIGSLLEFKLGNLHNVATKYALQFGDVFQLKVFHERLVFLNTAKLVRKAWGSEEYRRFFNDRPLTFYGENFLYGSKGVILNQYGYSHKHSELRKYFAKGLLAYGDGVRAFEDVIRQEVLRFMETIEAFNGEEFEFIPVVEQSLSNLLSILMCGETRTVNGDGRLFFDFVDEINYTGTPKFNGVMTVFPFLRYFPGPYGRTCRRIVELRRKLIDKFLVQQKLKRVPGQVRGLMDYLIEQQEAEMRNNRKELLLSDEMLFALIADIVLAGLITTRAALSNMILCLIHHPEYQRKIQNEIDDVIGRNRLPSPSDRHNLYMLEAVAMESQRYLTTGVVMAHLCNEDVNFEGFQVHKDSMVFPNMWFIHHDEKIWGDPWTFRPERFLDTDGKLLPVDHPIRRSWILFGLGRRHCIGESLARSRLCLYVATMLQRWDILPSKDKCRSCDPRDGDFEVKIVTTPKPFFCKVVERKD